MISSNDTQDTSTYPYSSPDPTAVATSSSSASAAVIMKTAAVDTSALPLSQQPSKPTNTSTTSSQISLSVSNTAQNPILSPPQPTFIHPKPLGDPIITVRHLSKQFTIPDSSEKITALKDIHLCPDGAIGPIRRGEFVVLRGPSGGGKTTLLNMLGTLDYPTNGEIEILGQRVDSNSTDDYLATLRLHRIGFVFQTFNLLATMSAFENVELPMSLLGKWSKEERKTRALKLLELVGLQDRVAHLPSELSGGEQQRVTIARALANEPEVLLLDEPTGDLDTLNTIEIMDLLLHINRTQQTTCIMVTHNPDIECYGDRILYLEDGRFVRQVLNRVQTPLVFEEYQEYLKRKDNN